MPEPDIKIYALNDPVLKKSFELSRDIYNDVEWMMPPEDNTVVCPAENALYKRAIINGQRINMVQHVIGLTKICGEIYCMLTYLHPEDEAFPGFEMLQFRYMPLEEMYSIRQRMKNETVRNVMDSEALELNRYLIFMQFILANSDNKVFVDAFYFIHELFNEISEKSRDWYEKAGPQDRSFAKACRCLLMLNPSPTPPPEWPWKANHWKSFTQGRSRRQVLLVAGALLLVEAEHAGGPHEGVRAVLENLHKIDDHRKNDDNTLESTVNGIKEYLEAKDDDDAFYIIINTIITLIHHLGLETIKEEQKG